MTKEASVPTRIEMIRGVGRLSRVGSRRESLMASYASEKDFMYSASQEEAATTDCRFDFQLTTQGASVNTLSLVERRERLHPAQYESENPRMSQLAAEPA